MSEDIIKELAESIDLSQDTKTIKEYRKAQIEVEQGKIVWLGPDKLYTYDIGSDTVSNDELNA